MQYSPRRIKITCDHAGVTHFGGTYFLHEFIRVLQLRDFLARHLTYPRPNSDYSLSQMLLALIYPIILGLDRIETASLLRSNGTFQHVTGLPSFPDPQTLRRFLLKATQCWERAGRYTIVAVFEVKRGIPTESLSMQRDPKDMRAFPPLGPAIKVLMVWPRFPASFWSLGEVMQMVPERSLMPPLGLITVAALCPAHWEIRLVDLAFQELRDEDILWADLVMVSAMAVQREGVRLTLERASKLNRRTMIGGPYASSEPDALLPLADHVVVGEPDEIFPQIASDLERGSARRLYSIAEKPDVSRTPVPRFDLLALNKYTFMSVQFSRGCPFTCEFCDIITIYGRRPRTKSPAQLTGELDALLQLGWRKDIFVVDDNFIGNHKAALELAQELEQWQRRKRYPFGFFTEASIDLASRPALLDAMVKANFCRVFIGIESPSAESLKETKKFQNLRRDLLDSIRFIQQHGLWVMGGFIIGFDSDPPDIFDRQIEFVERAAIPWAMTGVLQAPPTTPLYERMKKEGRLLENKPEPSNFDPPNFRTVLALPELLDGTKRMLLTLYDPHRFYQRVVDSLERWQLQPEQKASAISLLYLLRVLLKSVWKQGVLSHYRGAYWRFMRRLMMRWGLDPQKRRLGFELALSGHHFIRYARQVADALEAESRQAVRFMHPRFVPHPDGQASNLVQINSVPEHS